MMDTVVDSRSKALLEFLQCSEFKNASVESGLGFVVANRLVGVIRPADWCVLREFTDALELRGRTVVLTKWTEPNEITDKMEILMRRLHQLKAFPSLKSWRHEKYDVAEKFGDEPVFQIERSMSYIFGVKRYGVHINGYTIDSDGKISIWLQKRAVTKAQYAGLLDSMVGGGLGSRTSIDDCMISEADDEAFLSSEQCSKWCRPVGHVSFLYEDAKGIAPVTIFCFDALLPENFQPRRNGCEVENFLKLPLDDLLPVILDRTRFKITSVPVILDFLVRHHALDHRYGAAYFEVMKLIHNDLHFNYPPENVRICQLSQYSDTK